MQFVNISYLFEKLQLKLGWGSVKVVRKDGKNKLLPHPYDL